MDYETSANGWLARYTREGVTFSQLFTDSKFGGEDESFEAAKKWHDEIREIFPPMSRREFMRQKKVTNKSGHVGVFKATKKVKKKNGREYFYEQWVATWIDDSGQKKSKPFPIIKHGEEEAKRLAIAYREKMVSSLRDDWGDDYWSYRPGDRRIRTPYHREIYGYEGEEIYRIHRDFERDKDLRDKKIDAMLAEHGRLMCEVCEFDFEDAYGTLGKGVIEVHHIKPLSELGKSTKIYLEDLMCMCANCHLVIHIGNEQENLRKLKMIFETRKKKKEANKTSLLTPDPPPVPAVMTATTSTPSSARAPGQA